MLLTKNGWAVLDHDTHISKWVLEKDDLENERVTIESYVAPHVNLSGSMVIDVGALIGDHTATYSRLVGPTGRVMAFEPNEEAHACLFYNAKRMAHNNVTVYNIALGEREKTVYLKRSPNVGASHLQPDEKDSDQTVLVITLDSVIKNLTDHPRISLIKIDAEGYEPFILQGSAQTIIAERPAIYYEVNHGALARTGTTAAQIKALLQGFGYHKFRILERCPETHPQYNVLATP